MIKVKHAETGQVLNFPDGTPPEEMRSAMESLNAPKSVKVGPFGATVSPESANAAKKEQKTGGAKSAGLVSDVLDFASLINPLLRAPGSIGLNVARSGLQGGALGTASGLTQGEGLMPSLKRGAKESAAMAGTEYALGKAAPVVAYGAKKLVSPLSKIGGVIGNLLAGTGVGPYQAALESGLKGKAGEFFKGPASKTNVYEEAAKDLIEKYNKLGSSQKTAITDELYNLAERSNLPESKIDTSKIIESLDKKSKILHGDDLKLVKQFRERMINNPSSLQVQQIIDDIQGLGKYGNATDIIKPSKRGGAVLKSIGHELNKDLKVVEPTLGKLKTESHETLKNVGNVGKKFSSLDPIISLLKKYPEWLTKTSGQALENLAKKSGSGALKDVERQTLSEPFYNMLPSKDRASLSNILRGGLLSKIAYTAGPFAAAPVAASMSPLVHQGLIRGISGLSNVAKSGLKGFEKASPYISKGVNPLVGINTGQYQTQDDGQISPEQIAIQQRLATQKQRRLR